MHGTNPMTVLVEFEINTQAVSAAEWLTVWQQRADDAQQFEHETTAYATAINQSNRDQILVFERYERGDESLAVHVNRPARHTLHDTMRQRNMTKRRVTTSRFDDITNVGWWSRPAASPTTAAIIEFVGLRFPTVAQRDTFLAVTGEHANYCFEAEPGTLAYGAGVVTVDADRELDQTTGDLAFVAIYADAAAADHHANNPEHLARRAELHAKGVAVTPTFRRTYETTGHGFLWRT